MTVKSPGISQSSVPGHSAPLRPSGYGVQVISTTVATTRRTTTDSEGTGSGHSRDVHTSRPPLVTLTVTLSEPIRK